MSDDWQDSISASHMLHAMDSSNEMGRTMKDITLMPNDYIVTHIKTDTICEHFSNDDVVYVVEERIVPLVRCKECAKWLGSSGICMWDKSTSLFTKADDFCSYGERRE